MWVRVQHCKLQKGRIRLAAASDKVYQLPALCRWFSPGTPASATTTTGRHDIIEKKMLKVALNTKIRFFKKNIAATSDKVYQLLAQCRLFSPGTPASSTTTTGRHDIVETKLLKVALNTKYKKNACNVEHIVQGNGHTNLSTIKILYPMKPYKTPRVRALSVTIIYFAIDVQKHRSNNY